MKNTLRNDFFSKEALRLSRRNKSLVTDLIYDTENRSRDKNQPKECNLEDSIFFNKKIH